MSEPVAPAAENAGAAALSREQPWPGLMSFTEDAQAYFHGRDQEAAELLRLIKRETLTVLFGQSGLGKSSLLNAGLFPRLRAEDFLPVYVRLDVSPEARGLGEQVLDAVLATCAQREVDAPQSAGAASLWEFFHRKDADFWSARNRLLTPVVVLDQFEEIFTLGRHVEDMEQRCRAFLEELADLIENRAPATLARRIDANPGFAETLDFARQNCKVVLSLREDYLAEFEGLRGLIRSIMQNRLRLTRMNGEQAREAILRSGAHLVAESVAEQIIRFVAAARAGVRVDDDLARLEIEPALLSVVCRELNNQRIRRGQERISADMLQAGAQQQIIRDFYESSTRDIDARMREFIEDQLLTEAGFRDSYAYDDALALPGVTRDAINRLIARRLLRLEERSGVLRVELTHDLLTQVARESRDLRQKREAARRAAELDVARRRRTRRVAAIGGMASVAGIALAVVFGLMYKRAEQETKHLTETQSSVLLGQANTLFDQQVAGEPTATLARSIDLHRGNLGAVGRAVALLSQRAFPMALARYRISMEPGDQHAFAGWQGADQVLFRSQNDGGALITVRTGAFNENIVVRRAAPGGSSSMTRPGIGLSSSIPSPAAWGNTTLPIALSRDGAVAAWIEDESRPAGDDAGSPLGESTGPQVREGISRLVFGRPGQPGEYALAVTDGLRAPLVLSDDGARLMVRSARKNVSHDDPDDGHVLVFALPKQAAPVLTQRIAAANGSVRFGADGQRVAALAGSEVTLYDLATGRVRTLAHPLPVNALEVSPDGKRLATAGQDKLARLWDMDTGAAALPHLRHDGAVLSVSFDAAGRRLITGSLDGTARLWSADDGESLGEPMVSGTAVRDARISPDGKLALTYAVDGKLGIWRIGKLEPPVVRVQLPADIEAMEVHGKRAQVVVATADGEVALWRIADPAGAAIEPARVWSRRDPASVKQLRMSPDGKLLAVATQRNTVELWNVDDGKPAGKPLRHRAPVNFMRFSPDGTLLATASEEGAVRIWYVATQVMYPYVMAHARETVSQLAFSADHKLLLTGATADRSGALYVWDLTENALLGKLGIGNTLALAEFSGAREVVAVYDRCIKAWDLGRKPTPGPLLGSRGPCARTARHEFAERASYTFGGANLSAGLSPDGHRIVVGGLDGTSRLFDVANLRPFGEAMKSVGTVQGITFATDSRWVVTHSADSVARVWDAGSGHAVSDPAYHRDELDGAALAGGGAFLVSAGRNHTLEARRIGLDFPASAPRPDWLAKLVEAAGGGRFDEAAKPAWLPALVAALRAERFDQAGTMMWIPDRIAALQSLAATIRAENAPWWAQWASGTIARLAASGNAQERNGK